jgi:hypothetical protein
MARASAVPVRVRRLAGIEPAKARAARMPMMAAWAGTGRLSQLTARNVTPAARSRSTPRLRRVACGLRRRIQEAGLDGRL